MPIIDDPQELCCKLQCQKNSRALGIDYGDKRVGIAVSDITFSIATPLVTLESHKIFDKLFQIIDEYSVLLVVIGLPLSLEGQKGGRQLEKVKKFAGKLLSLRDINVFFWDERMSTHAAMRYIHSAAIPAKKQYVLGKGTKVRGNKQLQVKDKLAASFILQGILDLLQNVIKRSNS